MTLEHRIAELEQLVEKGEATCNDKVDLAFLKELKTTRSVIKWLSSVGKREYGGE